MIDPQTGRVSPRMMTWPLRAPVWAPFCQVIAPLTITAS